MRISTLFKTLFFFTVLLSFIASEAQTVLSAGDIAIIGFKTNNNTDAGNDAVKLLTLRELSCDTRFIVTDNNWNSATNNWFCNDDEFAVELTVTSTVLAGSIIYIDLDAAGGPVSSSTGALTKVSLGNPWGTNFGLNSQGDNVFVLQGSRLSPNFIFGMRHNGTFSTGGDCASGSTPRNNTGLPSGLSLGSTAIQMASPQNQWHYNCVSATTSLYINNRAAILSNISNNANWISTAGQQWNTNSCIFNILDQPFVQNGSIGVSGANCGCLSGCNLSAIGGPNCSPSVSGDCSAGQVSMSVDINVPAGCTYRVYATARNRTGCTASGMDSGDRLKVDVLGGSKAFINGSGNLTANDNFTLTGPGTIRVSGNANRADEIISYRILPSTCTGCAIILPIELLDFSAFAEKEAVNLFWSTASEQNNEYFILEKSTDAINFEQIAIVNGAGTSDSRQDYSFTDNNPSKEYNYYRVKNVDFNGTTAESPVIAISFNRTELVEIYPNPLSRGQKLNISAADKIQRLRLYNVYGQLVFNTSQSNASIELPDHILPGFYTLNIDFENYNITRKLVVN
jgi:hypothetical protein